MPVGDDTDVMIVLCAKGNPPLILFDRWRGKYSTGIREMMINFLHNFSLIQKPLDIIKNDYRINSNPGIERVSSCDPSDNPSNMKEEDVRVKGINKTKGNPLLRKRS